MRLHLTHPFLLPGTAEWSVMSVICILLFVGAMGKSAQFPLHVWLPDSMEGPTPISALIHAATMVTAGIFMVARMSPLFEFSTTALSFVLVIGAITGTLPVFEDYGTVLAVLAGGGAAAMSVQAVRRRSQTWVSIAMIGASCHANGRA